MLILLILPLLLFLPDIGSFIFTPGSHYSDLVISHYPNAIFLRQALQNGQGVPLWSPNILSGYPFAADPLSGLWYPPGWLSLVLPLPFGFNLLILLHLLLGGVGMYLWMRSKGMAALPAILGGLVFEMMPKLVSHFAAGHITLVYAVSWMPWLLWAEDSKCQSPKWSKLWISPGVVLGIICLADVRWAAYAGLLWVGYSIFSEGLFSAAPIKALVRIKYFLHYLKLFLDRILWLGVNILIAGLIAAPLLLPLVEYTRLSTRMTLLPEEAFTLSLPPTHLLGLLFPDPGGYAEWILYPGAVGLILLGVALFTKRIRHKASFWLWVLGLSLVYSLGAAIPYLDWLAKIPGFGLLRVPPRFLFLAGMAFAVVSCLALDELSNESSIIKNKLNLFLVGLIFFMVLFTGSILFLTGNVPFNIVWGSVCIAATALIVLLSQNHVLPGKLLAPGLVLICMINLGVVNWLSIEPQPIEKVLSEGEQTARVLSNDKELFRVFSPSYSIPQQTAALHGLELADGIDPLQLAAYVKFMEGASGIPSTGYSVTLPPFASADPKNDNRGYLPDLSLLGLLNIKYVVADYDLRGVELKLIGWIGNTRIYENPQVLPRAWVQQPDALLGVNYYDVDEIRIEPNQINIIAKGPGLLVLSELIYPGWEVTINKQSQSIQPVLGLLRGVELFPGENQVEFTFRPVSVLVGIILSLLVWCIVIVTRER